MAEALLSDLRVHAARKQLGGVAVAQVVESHLREILHLVQENGGTGW